MHANSGSLAVGELLGAASFIVSCVVGTMCIIKPFQVQKNTFLRDVGFFTMAITMVLLTLWDGKISRWEAYGMVGMYLSYVFIVIVATWREKRIARLQEEHNKIRSEYAEETYRDEGEHVIIFDVMMIADLWFVPVIPRLSLSPATPNRVRAVSAPTPPRLQTNLAPRPVSRSPSPSSTRVNQLPSFSLVGAIEFRDIVSSLQPHAGAPLDAWTQPITPFAGGHYHQPQSARSTRTVPNSLHNSVADIGNYEHSMTRLSPHPEGTNEHRPNDSAGEPIDYFAMSHNQSRDPENQSLVPTILHTPASPSDTLSLTETELVDSFVIDRRPKWKRALSATFKTLFPTLQNLRQASIISMITLITAAPPILALTLTLPVVVTPHHAQVSDKLPEEQAMSAISGPEDDVLAAEDMVEADLHGGLAFNKYLMAAQCVFGPLFCVKVILGESSQSALCYVQR